MSSTSLQHQPTFVAKSTRTAARHHVSCSVSQSSKTSVKLSSRVQYAEALKRPGPLSKAARPCRDRRHRVTQATAMDPTKSSQMLVIVPPHPLVKHFLAIARNKETPPVAFRTAIAELGRVLIYEAIKDWIPTVDCQVESPCGMADATIIDPTNPVKLVPILRAGLVPLELAHTVIPLTETYHLGYVRDEETLQPSLYLNKLPDQFPPGSKIMVSDPMLATGGTMVAAIHDLVARGADVKDLRIISIVAAPPALTKLGEEFPGLRIYTAMIDPELNDVGYIVPGLGDAGDRAFGTV